MSKLTEELRRTGVFNDHGFFNDGEDRVYISYSPRPGGRSPLGAKFAVYRFVNGREVVTDPDAAWYDNHRKSFAVYGDKAEKLAQAQAWCRERYGITEWKRSPFGGYGDAEFVKARLAALKAKLPERV